MLSQQVPETELNQKRTPEPPTSRSSPSPKPSPPKSLKGTSLQQTSLPPKSPQQKNQPQKSPQPKQKPKRPGRKLLAFDRRLGARFIAGTDEAGRGSLAGPLVVAGVLLDYACLKEHKVRPLTYLNDSKQCSEEQDVSPEPVDESSEAAEEPEEPLEDESPEAEPEPTAARAAE